MINPSEKGGNGRKTIFRNANNDPRRRSGEIFKSRCRYANAGPKKGTPRRARGSFAKGFFPCRDRRRAVPHREHRAWLYGNGRQDKLRGQARKNAENDFEISCREQEYRDCFFSILFCKFFFLIAVLYDLVTLIPIFCTSPRCAPWGRSPHFSRNARTPRPSPSRPRKSNNFEFALEAAASLSAWAKGTRALSH